MGNLQLDKIQIDIVYKALYLLAKEKGLELSPEIEKVCAAVAEQNVYDTDLVHIADVLESMTDYVKTNEDYEI